MRALTIWQPWASLIMVGAKPFEFRGRSYVKYANHPQPGERIVIHAGARPIKPSEVEDLLTRLGGSEDTTGLMVDKARALLLRLREAYKCRGLPLAAGLGTAVIGKPRNAGTIFGRSALDDVRGLYSRDDVDELEGRAPQDSDRGIFNWAWPLANIQPFETPIPKRGFQGFWTWQERRAA